MTEIQPRLLNRAIEIAGGRKPLAAKLRVEEHALALWMAGRATPPERVFHALVDLILEDDIQRAAQDRRREPRTALTVIDSRI